LNRDSIKNFIYGVGSILNIAPNTDYGSFLPEGSAQERINKRLERVRNRISESTVQFSNGQ